MYLKFLSSKLKLFTSVLAVNVIFMVLILYLDNRSRPYTKWQTLYCQNFTEENFPLTF